MPFHQMPLWRCTGSVPLGRKTFGRHDVWSTLQWPDYLADIHFVNKTINQHIIWLTLLLAAISLADISLADTSLADTSFG
jgi:hypothetical protein